METNPDVFKAFNHKYLLKSVSLGALYFPLFYRLYTKQKKVLIWNSARGGNSIFSHTGQV